MCRGRILVEAEEEEDIVFCKISMACCYLAFLSLYLRAPSEPKTLEEARAGIPVTTQRRFDVYPDVSAA